MGPRHRVETFLLRTASLPFETVQQDPAPATPGAYADPLPDLLRNPVFLEALRLASPDLFQAASRPKPKGPGGEKLEKAFWRYALRMSTRPTPFGIFASISLGKIGTKTALELAPFEDSRRRVQPDVLLLHSILQRWLASPAREEIRFSLAPQVVHLGSQIRLVPCVIPEQHPGLIEITATPLLLRFLELAKTGGTLGELAASLEQHWPRATPEKRRAYTEQLAELGLLVPELFLSPTGPEPLAQLLQSAAKHPSLSEEFRALQELSGTLSRLAALPPGQGETLYARAQQQLEAAPLGARGPHAFHVDLWRPSPGLALGPGVEQEALSACNFLASLSTPPSAKLEGFRQRLQERYDGRWVPLLHAIDDDYGVGFAKSSFREDLPLLDGIPLAPPAEESPSSQGRRLLARWLQEGQPCGELILRATDLGASPRPLPPTFTFLGALSAHGQEALDRGDFLLFYPFFLSSTGIHLLGRFAGLHPAIEELARACVLAEERATTDILADYVTPTTGRAQNVNHRPSMARYEIPLQGRAGAVPEQQIPLSDLLVGVEEQRVVLRSKSLGRRVRVRPTCAINPTTDATLPLQHFFGELQMQDVTGNEFLSWGRYRAPRLPRVRFGRTILMPARWCLGEEQLRKLQRGAKDAEGELLRLREQLEIPRWVGLADGDNTLAIDLDNPLGRGVLLQECQEKTSLVLEEFLPALLPRPLRGPEGTFVHELVLPFSSEAPQRPEPRLARVDSTPTVPPGRGVLFLKLYGAPGELERWLLRVLQTNLEGYSWFFVRYRDPQGAHLRVRVWGDHQQLWGQLHNKLLELTAAAQERGLLERVQLDTYVPETARYGGPEGVALAEKLFCADSIACLKLLALTASTEDRWRGAFLALDALLEDGELSPDEKITLCERAAMALSRELDSPDKVAHAMGERARHLRAAVEECVNSQESPWPEVREALRERSEAQRPLLRELRHLEQERLLGQSSRRVLSDFAHMTCNRLFMGAERQQEMMIWFLLARHHRALQARKQLR